MKHLELLIFAFTALLFLMPFQDLFGKGQVIFVHGFQPELFRKTQITEVREQLQKMFPEHEVISWPWERAYKTVGKFRECYYAARADEADNLATFLKKKKKEERENTILIGHSLGGAMVVDAMQRLEENGYKIYRGIFLGAAIPSNERDVDIAIRASLHPNINVYNCQDYVLKHLASLILEANILGSGGYTKDVKKSEMIQIQVKKYEEIKGINGWVEYFEKYAHEHDIKQYLSTLENYLKLERAIILH